MKKNLVALVMVLMVVAPHASAFPGGVPRLDTDRPRYRVDAPVSVSLDNASGQDVTVGETWSIRDLRSGEVVATYVWSEDQRTVTPDETLVWEWHQVSGCHGACPEPQPGMPQWQVGPGIYRAIVPTDRGTLRTDFHIGEFFTLGFTSRPALEFIVYVNRPDDVAAMRAEAETGDTDKQIVSGVVRRGKRYNPDWNFTMGPGSIVLGDVFIEVCDGSPYYVQRHRREWLGERWCPWSSYVKRIGR